jgi:hypothetical protein
MFFIIVAAFSPYNGAVTIQSIIPAKSSIINHPSFSPTTPAPHESQQKNLSSPRAYSTLARRGSSPSILAFILWFL